MCATISGMTVGVLRRRLQVRQYPILRRIFLAMNCSGGNTSAIILTHRAKKFRRTLLRTTQTNFY